MGLLDKLKSLFGSDQDGHSPARDTEPDVTVEHEPDAESEHAVKGTDAGRQQTDGEQDSTDTPETTVGESEPTTADEPESTTASTTEQTQPEPVDEELDEDVDEESVTDDTTASSADAGSAPDDEPDTDESADSPSVEEIKGIGPTYAGRLESVGIGTVADLAVADPSEVAEAAETGETRASDWVDRAQSF